MSDHIYRGLPVNPAPFTSSNPIDLRGNSLDFSTLSITQGHGDSDGLADDVIITGNGQTIMLLNTQRALISASDFLF
jgi:serralysin